MTETFVPDYYQGKLMFYVNYKTKHVEEDYPDAEDHAKWIEKGYQLTDLDTYLELRVKFYKHHQARIKKTLDQKLRRQQGYTPPSWKWPK